MTSRRRNHALLLAGALLGLVLPLATGPVAHAKDTAEGFEVVNTAPPTVEGDPAYGERVTADPGTWEPSDATFTYQWLLDGEPVAGAESKRYEPRLDDIGHRLRVQVTATSTDPETGEQAQGQALSDVVRVVRGTFTGKRPTIDGDRRYDHTLVLRKGGWSRHPDGVRVRWLRDGEPIHGATARRLHLGLDEFGKRISVRLTARKEGYHRAVVESRRTVRIMHRVPVRHTVTYRVETRGKIVADLDEFRRQVQETYDDPRGWRGGSGVAFRQVKTGGTFVVVLSEASQVPSFSSSCSAEWSCRVGDFVIINQMRWLQASPMWREQHQSIRDYRHMVVNHETGHWLGHDHATCPKAGALAPVMQQQSKGLDGCRPNPWPTPAEWRVPRFG